MVYEINEIYPDYLVHHGILGQKWGVRRYQNSDGTLTAEGRARYYGKSEADNFTKQLRKYNGSGSLGQHGRLANSVQLKSVARDVRPYWKEAQKYNMANEKISKSFQKRADLDKWVQKAAQSSWKGRETEIKRSGFADFNDWLDFYREAERNGDGYAFDFWLKHSGDKLAKEYSANEKKMTKVMKEKYLPECRKAVKSFMGEHGDETFEFKTRFGSTVTSHKQDLADRGVNVVADIMLTWDMFGEDAPANVFLRTIV